MNCSNAANVAAHCRLGFPALKPPAAFTAAPAISLATHFASAAAEVLGACSDYAAAHPGQPCWLVSVPATNAGDAAEGSGRGVAAAPLTEWHADGSSGGGELCLAMVDCCNLPGNPGWPLRNMLLLAAARWRVAALTVVCLRRRRGRFDAEASIVLQVRVFGLGIFPTPLQLGPLGFPGLGCAALLCLVLGHPAEATVPPGQPA